MRQPDIHEVTHPISWGEIEKLYQPETDRKDRQHIVRQLLARASRNLGARSKMSSHAEPAGQYDSAIQQALQGTQKFRDRMACEQREAGRLLDALDGHPPARRQVMVRNDRRFQTWGLFHCLQEKYRLLLGEHPEAALETAELAWSVARNLNPAAYGEERVHDFQSSALVALGNVRRLTGDLEGAKTALEKAETVLALGTGDPLDKAELEALRSDLLRASGESEAANKAMNRAVRLRERVGGMREPKPESEPLHEPLHHRLHAAIPGFRPRRR